VLRLARKELREILRDRRTIVTLIAMPILLYPLMSVLLLQFTLASQATAKAGPKYRIATLSAAEGVTLQDRLNFGREELRRAAGKTDRKEKTRSIPDFEFLSDDSQPEPTTEAERARALDRLKETLQEGSIDLIAVIPDLKAPVRKPAEDRDLSCQLISVSSSTAGRDAVALVESLLAAANEANLKARLNVLPGPITMLSTQHVTLKGAEPETLLSLSALVPLVLILMTITGAVYPAIDLTAGERERGTLEILVAAPVPRFELLTAKYLSVVTVAVLNAIVNLVCMTLTLKWSGVSALLPGIQELSFVLLLQVFALLLLFAAFFSAVLLCLTSFARSFKEAQAYLIPLMLASLAPGVMAMMPGLKLDRVLASLPLVNIVLMARDLFETGVDPVNGTIVVVTTFLYALAALALAARVFGAESVLYSEQSSWADLLRRPDEPQKSASLPAMLWCLALMVPIQFGLHALVRSLGPPSIVVGIVLGLAINLLLFGMLPGLFSYLGRVELRAGLGLALPRPAGLLAGLLLGLSLWPLELKLLEESGVAGLIEERFKSVLNSLQEARDVLGWGVLAIVIVPAILEEVFFRGLLFNALKARAGALITIAVSGLLFGAAHIILDGALGLERLVPTALLGLILSAVCWRTGSLWPSMIQHVCHNSMLLIVALYDPGSTKEIPWTWLAGGAVGALIGAALLWPASRAEVKPQEA
jgi:ABC-2 type transport system permease protein/sodium transport system permease protein